MKSTLLIIGGAIQILIVALHITIFFGISSAEISSYVKESVHIFNAAVLTIVIFFAYISFFHRHELLNTMLGKIVLLFIAVFYLQRGLVEAFLRGIKPLNLSLFIVIAALYIVPIFLLKKEEKEKLNLTVEEKV